MSINSVVGLVAGKIGELLAQEAKFLYGVEDKVQSLQRELMMMDSFLEDMEAKDEEGGDQRTRTTINQIRKLVYDAEDVIESYILEAQPSTNKAEDLLKRYACFCSPLLHTHQVGSEIETIKEKIAETMDMWKKYRGENVIIKTNAGAGLNSGSRTRKIAYSHTNEEHVVGLEEDINKLVGILTTDATEIQVLSIVGMGGSGKTTLARKLYNHESVKGHFDCTAWLSISKEWVAQQILIELLRQASGETMGNNEAWSRQLLVEKLHRYLEGKRYLIVLDDVWEKQALREIFPALPNDGRRIIVTTRKREVIDFLDIKSSIHEPRRLTEEESWDLFRKKALIHREQNNNSMDTGVLETLGKEMLKKCEGLPLAVIALAGILVKKDTLEDWERVKKAVSSWIMKEGDVTPLYGPVNEMLTLSYNDLRRDLKPCFLYLAMFREDTEIQTRQLIKMWIAEGFIPSDMCNDGETLEDVAQDYLEELIDRCVVQIASNNYKGKVKSIRVHDLVRDLCIGKAKKQGFLEMFTSQSSDSGARVSELRRTAIYCLDEKMDKRWMQLPRLHEGYKEGIYNFMNWVYSNANGKTLFHCPCAHCRNGRQPVNIAEMYAHLWLHGMEPTYTVWDKHGEPRVESRTSQLRRQILDHGASSSCEGPVMDILHDSFPYHAGYNAFVGEGPRDADEPTFNDVIDDDYRKYERLLVEAQTPLYPGSTETVLGAVLNAMKMKVVNGWSDKSMHDLCRYISGLLPPEHKYPIDGIRMRKICRDIGLGYQSIDACAYNCVLFYKQYANYEVCPICHSSRWETREGRIGSKIPRKVLRYFPLTPRLKRLYMEPHIAKQMRWHGERVKDNDWLKHPADGEAWQEFDRLFPHFSNDVRNVRLGLATDGFNPFGTMGTLHSTWPVIVMPYNLPPSMCMKKEFNMLTLLIPGPKSPGKCLSVFMEPLIDELIGLWETGVYTFDRHSRSTFTMRAAMLWTISDFPGLGMLAGSATKGYKACPICLDEVSATHEQGRMVYDGHRRWLGQNHPWRSDRQAFNGKCEYRPRPRSFSGEEVLAKINRSTYPVLSLHEKFKVSYNSSNRGCWTTKCIFWRLPYWPFTRVRYTFDIMHIEKNVFDNIIGTILSIDGKSKDGPKARAALQHRGVRKNQWERSNGRLPHASFLVKPEDLAEVFEWFSDVKYPHGYAGSLKNKVNVREKKFQGLKTHDCHVMFQRLLPVVVRAYLPLTVVKPLVALSRWFQKLCARELRKEEIRLMEDEIVQILCSLEMIFPPHFFTIMVHLMVHLPHQVLQTGPVHYTWMFPIERQLGAYKKHVANTRYPEGCITERYVTEESITYCSLYLGVPDCSEEATTSDASNHDISVVSDLVRTQHEIFRLRLSEEDIAEAHWQVLLECDEVTYYLDEHEKLYRQACPIYDERSRKISFLPYFLNWVAELKRAGNNCFKQEVLNLARKPQGYRIYSSCYVNGVKFVSWQKDQYLRTQNCGVMVETPGNNYYGVLEFVVELLYANRMPVVLFKCKWYDTDPQKSGSTKLDQGVLSVDTNSSWYEDSPFCLAVTARQVFYVDDPKAGEAWKVVNVMSQRNVYDARTLATNEDYVPQFVNQAEELGPYQELGPIYSGFIDLTIDLDSNRCEEEGDEDDEEDEEEEDEEEDEEEEDEEEDEDGEDEESEEEEDEDDDDVADDDSL